MISHLLTSMRETQADTQEKMREKERSEGPLPGMRSLSDFRWVALGIPFFVGSNVHVCACAFACSVVTVHYNLSCICLVMMVTIMTIQV